MDAQYPDLYFEEGFDKITMGVIHYIKQKYGIYDVRFSNKKCVNNDLIESWEEGNCCKLPEDLKNFYFTLNGFFIEWDIELNQERHSVGRLELNSLESLVLITKYVDSYPDDIALCDLDLEDKNDSEAYKKPCFQDKIFELSSDESFGKVCLVYKDKLDKKGDLCESEIWFLDYSLRWHYLASSFTHYFRMLIIHIGIPGWQYLFTDVGLGPETKFWFSMYIPYRFADRDMALENDFTPQRDPEKNKVDFSTLFKSKTADKRKPEQVKQMKNQPASKQRGTKGSQSRSLYKNTK